VYFASVLLLLLIFPLASIAVDDSTKAVLALCELCQFGGWSAIGKLAGNGAVGYHLHAGSAGRQSVA